MSIAIIEYQESNQSDFSKKASKPGIYPVSEAKIIELTTNADKTMLGIEYHLVNGEEHVEPFYPNDDLVAGTKFENISQGDLTKMLILYAEEVTRTKDKKITYKMRQETFKNARCEGSDQVLRFFSTRYDISQFIGKLMQIHEIKITANLGTQAAVEKFLLGMKMEKPFQIKVIAIKKQNGEWDMKSNTQANGIMEIGKSFTFTPYEAGAIAGYNAFLSGSTSGSFAEKSAEDKLIDAKAIDSIFGD